MKRIIVIFAILSPKKTVYVESLTTRDIDNNLIVTPTDNPEFAKEFPTIKAAKETVTKLHNPLERVWQVDYVNIKSTSKVKRALEDLA